MANVSKSRKDKAPRSNPSQAARGSDKNSDGLSALEALAMELSIPASSPSSTLTSNAQASSSDQAKAHDAAKDVDNVAKETTAVTSKRTRGRIKKTEDGVLDASSVGKRQGTQSTRAAKEASTDPGKDASGANLAEAESKANVKAKVQGATGDAEVSGAGATTDFAVDANEVSTDQGEGAVSAGTTLISGANAKVGSDAIGSARRARQVGASVEYGAAGAAGAIKGAKVAGTDGAGVGTGSGVGEGAGAGDEALAGVANMDAGIVADESALLSSDVSSAQHDSNNQLGDQRARLAAESVLRKVDKGHLSASSEDHQLHHISGKTFDLSEIFPDIKLLSKSEQDLVNEDFLSGYDGKLNHLLNYRRLERMGATEFGVISEDGLRDLIAKTYEQADLAHIDELYKLFTNVSDKQDLKKKVQTAYKGIGLEQIIDINHPCQILRFTEEELSLDGTSSGERFIECRRMVQESFANHEEKLLKAIIDSRIDPMAQEYQELVFYRYMLAWRTGDKADFERYKQLVELQNLYTLFKLLVGSFKTRQDFDILRYCGKSGLEQIAVYTNPHDVKEFSLIHFIYLLEPLQQCLMDDAPFIADWLESLSIIDHNEIKSRYFSEGLPYDFNFVSPVLSFVTGQVTSFMHKDNAQRIMDGLKDAERRPFMYYDIFVGNSRAKCEKHHDFAVALKDIGGSIENALKDNEFTPQMQEWLLYLHQLISLDLTLNLLESLNLELCSYGRLWFMNKMAVDLYYEMFNYWCTWQSNIERKQKFVTNHINYCMTKFSQGRFAEAFASDFIAEARNLFLEYLAQRPGLLSSVQINDDLSVAERLSFGRNKTKPGFATKLEGLTQEFASTKEFLSSSLLAILRGNNGVTGELKPEEFLFLRNYRFNPKERANIKIKVIEGFNQILHMHLDIENHPEVHMNLDLAQYIGDTGSIPLIPGISAHSAFLIARALQTGDFGIRDPQVAQLGFFYADLSGHYLATMYKANLYCPMFDSVPGETYLSLLLRANFAAHLTAYCDECLYGSKYLGAQVSLTQVEMLKSKKSSYELQQAQAQNENELDDGGKEHGNWGQGAKKNAAKGTGNGKEAQVSPGLPPIFDAGIHSQEVLDLLKTVPFGMTLNEGLFHNIVTLPDQFPWLHPECNFQAPGGLKKLVQFDKLLVDDKDEVDDDRLLALDDVLAETTNLNRNPDPYSWQTYRALNLFKSKVRMYDTPEYANTYYNSWALNSEEYARVFKQINPAFQIRRDDEGYGPEGDNFYTSILCNAITFILDFVEVRSSDFETYQTMLYNLMQHLYSVMERQVCHHGCLVLFKFLSSSQFMEFVSTDNRFRIFYSRSRLSQMIYSQLNELAPNYNEYTELVNNLEANYWDIAGIFLQLGMCSPRLRELGYNLLDRALNQRLGNFLPACMPYLDELFKTSAALHNGNSISYLDAINRQNHKIEQADLFALVGKMTESIRTYRDVVRYYTRYDLGEARLELAQHMVLLRQPYGYYEMFLCLKDNPERMREAHTYLYYAAKFSVGEAQHDLEALQQAQLFKPLPFLVYFLSLQELAQHDLSALLCMLSLSVDSALVPCNFTDYLKILELYNSKFSNSQLKHLLFRLGLIDLDRSLGFYDYFNLVKLFPNPLEGLMTSAEAVNGNFTALHNVLNWTEMFAQINGTSEHLSVEECDARVRVLLTKLCDTLLQGKTRLEGLLAFNWARSFSFPKCLNDRRKEILEQPFVVGNGMDAALQEHMYSWISEALDSAAMRYDDWSLILPFDDSKIREAEMLSEFVWNADNTATSSRKSMQMGALMAMRSHSGRSYSNVFSALIRYLANSGDLASRHYALIDFSYMQVVPYGNRFDNYVGHPRRELICKIAQQKKGTSISELLNQVVEQFDPKEVQMNRYLRDVLMQKDQFLGKTSEDVGGSGGGSGSGSGSTSGSVAGANAASGSYEQTDSSLVGEQPGSYGQSGQYGPSGQMPGLIPELSGLDSPNNMSGNGPWNMDGLANVVVETILDDAMPAPKERSEFAMDSPIVLGSPGTFVPHEKLGTNELLNYSYFLMLHSHCGVIPALVCMKNPWLLNRKANGPIRSYSSLLARAVLNNEPGAWQRYLYYVQSHYFKYNLNNEDFEGENSKSTTARKFVNDVLQLNISSRKFQQFLDGMRKEGVDEFDSLLYSNDNGYVPGRYKIINHDDLANGLYDAKSGMGLVSHEEGEEQFNLETNVAIAARESLKTLASKIDKLSEQNPKQVVQSLVEDPALAGFLGQDASRLKDGNLSHHWINYTFYPEANVGSQHDLLQMLPFTNSLLEECIRENVGLSLEDNHLLPDSQELSFLYNPRLVQWHLSKFRIQQEERFDHNKVEPEQALQRFEHTYDNALYQIDRTRFNILKHAPVQGKSLNATIEAQAAWGAMRNQQLDLQSLNANYALPDTERQAAWQSLVSSTKAQLSLAKGNTKAQALAQSKATQTQAKQNQSHSTDNLVIGEMPLEDSLSAVTLQENGHGMKAGGMSAEGMNAGVRAGATWANRSASISADEQNQLITEDGYDSLLEQRLLQAIYHHSPMIDEVFYSSAQSYYKELLLKVAQAVERSPELKRPGGPLSAIFDNAHASGMDGASQPFNTVVSEAANDNEGDAEGYHAHEDDKVINENRSSEANLLKHLQSFLSEKIGDVVPPSEVDAASSKPHNMRDELDVQTPIISKLLKSAWNYDESQERQFTRPAMFYEDENPLHTVIYLMSRCYQQHMEPVEIQVDEAIDLMDSLVKNFGYFYGACDVVDSCFAPVIIESFKRRYYREAFWHYKVADAITHCYSYFMSALNTEEELALMPEIWRMKDKIPQACLRALNASGDITLNDLYTEMYPTFLYMNMISDPHTIALTHVTRAQVQEHVEVLMDDSFLHQGMYDFMTAPSLIQYSKCVQGNTYASSVRQWHSDLLELSKKPDSNYPPLAQLRVESLNDLALWQRESEYAIARVEPQWMTLDPDNWDKDHSEQSEFEPLLYKTAFEFKDKPYIYNPMVEVFYQTRPNSQELFNFFKMNDVALKEDMDSINQSYLESLHGKANPSLVLSDQDSSAPIQHGPSNQSLGNQGQGKQHYGNQIQGKFGKGKGKAQGKQANVQSCVGDNFAPKLDSGLFSYFETYDSSYIDGLYKELEMKDTFDPNQQRGVIVLNRDNIYAQLSQMFGGDPDFWAQMDEPDYFNGMDDIDYDDEDVKQKHHSHRHKRHSNGKKAHHAQQGNQAKQGNKPQNGKDNQGKAYNKPKH